MFASLLLIAPYGVIMGYRWCWSSKVPLAPDGAPSQRFCCQVSLSGFVPDGAGVACPFSEGWLLLGSRGADLDPPFYED